MPLRIEIYKHKGQPVERQPPFTISEQGGTIGRAKGNTIVLQDDGVSRRHARIIYENGSWYLIDDSSNGTLIFNRDIFIQGDEAELSDGDCIRLGDHELRVSITEEDAESELYPPYKPPRATPPGVAEARNRSTGVSPEVKGKTPVPVEKELSIDDFFKDTEAEAVKESKPGMNEPSWADTTGSMGEGAAVPPRVHETRAPRYEPPVRPVPPDLRDETASYTPKPEETGRTFQDAYSELLERFLKGAEVEDSRFLNAAELPDLMEELGAVFRELVNGIWRVLRGRAELKAEMRLAMTMVRPAGNNPLKLSPSLEDAVKGLLKKAHPSYLGPLEAVREGFEDIMNHELALGAGMQASLTEALSRFDPERFDKNKDSSLLQTKGHIWKAYCKAYPELREAAVEGIFGKAFAKAYEDQLAKLRSRKKRD